MSRRTTAVPRTIEFCLVAERMNKNSQKYYSISRAESIRNREQRMKLKCKELNGKFDTPIIFYRRISSLNLKNSQPNDIVTCKCVLERSGLIRNELEVSFWRKPVSKHQTTKMIHCCAPFRNDSLTCLRADQYAEKALSECAKASPVATHQIERVFKILIYAANTTFKRK